MNNLKLIQYAIECVINSKTDRLADDEESFATLQLLFKLYDDEESVNKGYLPVRDMS